MAASDLIGVTVNATPVETVWMGKDSSKSWGRNPVARATASRSCCSRKVGSICVISPNAGARVPSSKSTGTMPTFNCSVIFEDGTGAPAFGEMTQIDPTFGMQHEREAVARATGLRPQDFDE